MRHHMAITSNYTSTFLMKVIMFWQNLKSMKHIQQEELTKTLLDINALGEVAVGLS